MKGTVFFHWQRISDKGNGMPDQKIKVGWAIIIICSSTSPTDARNALRA